jgi:hypothetical protein
MLKIASLFSAKILLSGKLFCKASAKISRFFPFFFFAILVSKTFQKNFFMEKKIIIKNFSVFSAKPKTFPLAENFLKKYFYQE